MANTKVTSNVLADDAVTISKIHTQTDSGGSFANQDPSDGHALVAKTNTNGYHLSWESVGVSGISSSADSTAITIDSSENVTFSQKVGIGVSPTHNFNLSSAGAVEARFASTDNDCYLQIASDTDEGQDSVLQFLSGSSARGSITYDHNTTAASQNMIFKTGDNAVSAMTLTGDGKMIMNASVPSIQLTDTDNNADAYIQGTDGNLRFFADDSGESSNSMITFSVDGSERMRIAGGGKHTFYGTHQGDNVGHFLFTNEGFDSSSTNCSLVVENSHSFVQFMAWAHLGCRIGTRTAGWNATGNQTTHLVSADATFIYGSSNGTAYLGSGTAITSDERLKKNIVSTPDGQLTKINALRPVSFDWKNETRESGEGFIAQEVEQVIPEAVTESTFAPDPDDDSRDFEGDVKSIRDSVLLSRLVKAVQELSAKNDALEARIETLESN